MKKVVLMNVFLFMVLFGMAQGDVTHFYEYDSAGNRIRRTTIRLRQAVANNPDTVTSGYSDSKQEALYKDIVGENNVKIFPNPTKGLVTLQFENPINKGIYRITDLSGKLLSEGNIQSTIVTLDLSPYKNGIYLLKLTLDGKTDT